LIESARTEAGAAKTRRMKTHFREHLTARSSGNLICRPIEIFLFKNSGSHVSAGVLNTLSGRGDVGVNFSHSLSAVLLATIQRKMRETI
jgi:hypothetical protein